MLGLRLKYDLKALMRMTWPLYVAVIAMSIGIYVFDIVQDWPIFDMVLFDMFIGIYGFIYIMALISLMIWPIVVCVRDFFNTMLKDEGYLTNTLPVSRNTLILSKELAGLIIFLISCLLLVVSLFVIVMPGVDFLDLRYLFLKVYWSWEAVVTALMLVVMGLVSAYSSITLLFLSMMLGQMHRSSKGIFSVAYYFLISFGMHIVMVILTMGFGFAMDTEFGWYIGNALSLFARGHEWLTIIIVFGLISLYQLIIGVAFHSISVWIANHKLNLE